MERDLVGDRTRIANLEGRWLHRTGAGWEAGPRHLLLDPATTAIIRPDQL